MGDNRTRIPSVPGSKFPGEAAKRALQISSCPAISADGVRASRPPAPPPFEPAFAGNSAQKLPDSKSISECTDVRQVPADIDFTALTVAEVAHCLHLLKFDSHCAEFKDNDIDGKLFSELSESDLCKDFGFKGFEVKKLMMFKTGWRPN